MLDGGRTPLVTFKELEAMGYSRCSIPVMSIYAAARGLLDAATQLFKEGTNRYLQDKILPFTEFNELIGLPEIRKLESRFLPEETIQKKYGTAKEPKQRKTTRQ
jgi:2-methylisocitrate lyase-like PEP mutase family enzyme